MRLFNAPTNAGLAVLSTDAPKLGNLIFKGRVERVKTSNLTGAPTLLFDVVPEGAGFYGGMRTGILENVSLLQAGFGALNNPMNSPTGIVYIPEVGSKVAVAFDGSGYVIIGFYTGPAKNAGDFGNTVSMNPGIETTENKVGSGSLGGEREWFFGANPGDVILGKGLSRLKITGDAVIAASSPNCMDMWKTNDCKIERCKELDVRMLGYMKSHKVEMGIETQASAHFNAPSAVPPPAGAAVTTEIFEATPYVKAKKSFLMEQKGHITEGLKADARQAILGTQGILTYTQEEQAKKFTLDRKVVITPLPTAKLGMWFSDETFIDHYITYDKQIDNDGSFREKAGNLKKQVGPPSTLVADYDISYDALTNTYSGRVGLVTFTINGITGAVTVNGTVITATALVSANVVCGASSVSLTPVSLNLTAPTVNITAATKINLSAPNIGINGTLSSFGGPMDVKGFLTVEGNILTPGNVSAGSVSAPLVESQGKVLAMHVHPYADSPTFVTPPYPTTQPPL